MKKLIVPDKFIALNVRSEPTYLRLVGKKP